MEAAHPASPATDPPLLSPGAAPESFRRCPPRRRDRPARRAPGRATEAAIARWRGRLGVRQRVRAERISRFQVTGPSGRAGAPLVAVHWDDETATIYHTRALTEEDIVHELLHVAHPAWSEAEVVQETERQLRATPEPAAGAPLPTAAGAR